MEQNIKTIMNLSRFIEELPRRIFIVCLVFSILVVVFISGALSYRNDLPPIPQLEVAYKALFVDGSLTDSIKLQHLQPSRGNSGGVIVSQTPDNGTLVLMVGFFEEENQARLIARDGTLVRKWSLDYFEHFPVAEIRPCNMASSLQVDVHGALLTPEGELVFNYEYCGTVKLDQCGELMWTINKPTHHSLIRSEAGGYLLLSRQVWFAAETPERFAPFSAAATDDLILEDTLLRVNEAGEILEEVSIPELMRENGLEALLTANGEDFTAFATPRAELVHANKVAELPLAFADAFPLFAAGDLAISMRKLNLVMVIDPLTKAVKWHQTGPWLRQHDAEFRRDGRISIFNNNVYHTAYVDKKVVLDTPFTTNIVAVDPVTRETEVLFGEKPGQKMLSVIRGQHELLKDDGMLITEFDAGRVLQVNADGKVVWEYVNRYDDEYVGEVANSALYSADYFEVDWETCRQ